MERIVYFFLMVMPLLSISSCTKEDFKKCFPQYTVQVYVKDKNYFNIDKITQLNKIDENAIFSSYIGKFYYSLRNSTTGAVVAESSSYTPVNVTMPYHTLTFDNIPDGKYELVVWGNVEENVTIGTLHPNRQEGTDIYMADTVLQFSSSSRTAKMNMERTKGKLLVICNNFPTEITQMEQRVSSIYETIDSHFNYSGSAEVVKTSAIKPLNETILAPSLKNLKSELNLHFFQEGKPEGAGSLTLPEINIQFNRNEISVIAVDYKEEINSWEIWILEGYQWKKIHHLDIENFSL